MISCQNNNKQSQNIEKQIENENSHYQSKKQKVFFKDFVIQVPSNWEYEKNNLSFRSREKDSRNTLTINYMNLDIDTKAALIEAKKMSSGTDFFDNAKFTDVERGKFKGFPSSEISFSGYKEGDIYKGTLMTFKFKNQIIFLTKMGKENFINGKVLSNIISSIQVN